MQSEPAPLPKAVILISGSGSNLQAIIDEVNEGELPLEIAAVISNVPEAYGIQRAQEAEINTHSLDHRKFAQRELFDAELIRTIEQYQPDIVVLAGFMRILSNDFVNRYLGKLVNIHPSLLPKYPGLNTHQRAIDAQDKHHGVTIHYVIPELDAGPNIVQAKVEITENDTPETLASRVQQQEHVIYPIVLKWLSEGRLALNGNHATLDGQQLPDTGLILDSSRVLH
jgi:phosphoribosylglycinamide formyltransferase 1